MKPGKNQGDGLRRVLAVLKHHVSNIFAAAPFLQPPLDDAENAKFSFIAGELLKGLEKEHGYRARLVVPMMMHHASTRAIVDYLQDARATKTLVKHSPEVKQDLAEASPQVDGGVQ
jgi:hypothetical protein